MPFRESQFENSSISPAEKLGEITEKEAEEKKIRNKRR